jgi:ribosomal protein S18 acetylase RimI-like enzyme
MSKYIFRPANLNDVDFLVKTIIEAEKSGSEIFSYSKVFNLSEDEVAAIFKEMFLEEIEGCEFSVSSYIVAEFENKVVAAIGAWVEEEGNPSSKIKSNLLGYYLPKDAIHHAAQLAKITSELFIPHPIGTLSIVMVYVTPDHRGRNLIELLTNEHIKLNSEIKELSVQVMSNNLPAIKSYLKVGFETTHQVKCNDEKILHFLPGDEKLLMKKKLN